MKKPQEKTLSVKQLERQRDEAANQLRELAQTMLIGTASETYRTCGTPTCRCHTTGPKHGPNIYVNYRGEHGKTTGYYVPKAFHEPVIAGLAAWTEFQERAKEVARCNQELIKARKAAAKEVAAKRKS